MTPVRHERHYPLMQFSLTQMPSLITPDLFNKSPKILFIAHLALGDFTYLQNFFQAFALTHPQLQVDLWVDEVRRTNDASRWKNLSNYSLYDWVENCSCFHKIYKKTYSPALYQESIREAQQENYPVVVSLATLRPHRYAALARQIAGSGFVIGMQEKSPFTRWLHRNAYRKLDASIRVEAVDRDSPRHISAVYADWFDQLAGIKLAAVERFPFVTIPEKWNVAAALRLSNWDVTAPIGQLIFINPFAKTKKRCWPLERVISLIQSMQQRDDFRDARFIVNAAPSDLAEARAVFEAAKLERTELFCAEDNFFQLPAILKKCDLIISVETAVMHLANAVHVPVIALMRQKNPEWVPLDADNSRVIFAPGKREWVNAITVAQVMKEIQ
jgi:heptosyltransferase-3